MNRRRWTVERVMEVVRSKHPEPFAVSWRWTQQDFVKPAAQAAVRAGLLRRIAGPPGFDWYALDTAAPGAIP